MSKPKMMAVAMTAAIVVAATAIAKADFDTPGQTAVLTSNITEGIHGTCYPSRSGILVTMGEAQSGDTTRAIPLSAGERVRLLVADENNSIMRIRLLTGPYAGCDCWTIWMNPAFAKPR